MSTTGYSMTQQINDLNAELREARAQIAAIEATDRRLIEENGKLEAQIAAKDAALRDSTALVVRLREGVMSAEGPNGEDLFDIDDAETVMAEAADVLAEARAQIAAKDAALLQVLASLVATTSLIIRAEDMKVKPSKAVASNAMFTQMLKDYDNATIAGRAALAAPARETE